MVNVVDIRQTLIDEHGYSEEAVKNIKGKANLITTLETEMDKNKKLPNLNEVEDDYTEMDRNGNEHTPIEKSDPKWHDYVMEHFVKEELVKGNPITDGLRRVAEILLGGIGSITSKVVQCPTPENGKRAVVTVKVTFHDGEMYDGSSDVYEGNTERPFSLHPTSTAETKAEGRALRKALRLRKITAAEEMGGIDLEEQQKISDTQINFIDLTCRTDRLDINIKEFLKLNEHSNIKDLTHQQSLDLQEKLSQYQRDTKLIPDELKTYQPNWREK